MIVEIKRQFDNGLLSGDAKPEYGKCIQISTDASLKKMIAPGLLVIVTPLATGFIFGSDAVAGLLAGLIVSGV
jgi:Na+/H+-translocating membrane pyrophosphatase